jgi:hypothetical protein
MPVTAYFGDRFDQFTTVCGIDDIFATDVLPPDRHADIVVVDGKPSEESSVRVGTIGVVSSENHAGLSCLMRSGVRTVTCGMSRRDTVTLSSSVADIVVCLQRRLPTFTGSILEPAEYTVITESDDPVCVLLATAVRLLSGREP